MHVWIAGEVAWICLSPRTVAPCYPELDCGLSSPFNSVMRMALCKLGLNQVVLGIAA